MKIAYRRMSGPIGTTNLEIGTRGLWLEKRRALVGALLARGHTVDYVNRMTKFSQLLRPATFDATYDLLFIEFGSRNTVFYGKDLEETSRYVALHRGRIVFLCDDPDLPYLWSTVEPRDYGRWSVWVNAKRPQPFAGSPKDVRVFDAPFSVLLPEIKPVNASRPLLYIGRPNGREKMFRELIHSKVPFTVAGRAAEWKGLDVLVSEPPTQADRQSFYSTRLGSLAIADKKHKVLGWRTGRAYHALHAGCPSVVEYDHEALLDTFPSFGDAEDLSAIVDEWSDGAKRAKAWKQQRRFEELQDKPVMEQLFKEFSL